MKKNPWSDPDIEKSRLLSKIRYTETLLEHWQQCTSSTLVGLLSSTTEVEPKIGDRHCRLQKYGAEHAGASGKCSKSGLFACEEIERNIWKINGYYLRVDVIHFPEKPFLVLEFSENYDGPYEDADPFPYDLSDDDLEREIKLELERLD